VLLISQVWGDDARVIDRVVDAHICMIRKKLSSKEFSIKAVTGIGYKLQALKRKAAA